MLPFRFLGFLYEDKLFRAAWLYRLKPDWKAKFSLESPIELSTSVWVFWRCPNCCIFQGCKHHKKRFGSSTHTIFFRFLCGVWKITHPKKNLHTSPENSLFIPRVQCLAKPLFKIPIKLMLCWTSVLERTQTSQAPVYKLGSDQDTN